MKLREEGYYWVRLSDQAKQKEWSTRNEVIIAYYQSTPSSYSEVYYEDYSWGVIGADRPVIESDLVVVSNVLEYGLKAFL